MEKTMSDPLLAAIITTTGTVLAAIIAALTQRKRK
jgi:hypothetical protein